MLCLTFVYVLNTVYVNLRLFAGVEKKKNWDEKKRYSFERSPRFIEGRENRILRKYIGSELYQHLHPPPRLIPNCKWNVSSSLSKFITLMSVCYE